MTVSSLGHAVVSLRPYGAYCKEAVAGVSGDLHDANGKRSVCPGSALVPAPLKADPSLALPLGGGWGGQGQGAVGRGIRQRCCSRPDGLSDPVSGL